jgi:DNA polymerase IV (archaeal DinB-like DNA polymerase)
MQKKTLKYYVGCSVWDYSSQTDFSPHTLDESDYLVNYSKVFDFVEIDLGTTAQKVRTATRDNYLSSLPTGNIIKKWSQQTPKNFRFVLKLPVTLANDTDGLREFLEVLAPIKPKILALLVHQASLTVKNGRHWLEGLLNMCAYHGYSIALEFDQYSWYQDSIYDILKRHKAALIWSDIVGSRGRNYYPVVTGDFLYLRINVNENMWIKKIKDEVQLRERRRNAAGQADLNFAAIVVDKPSEVNKILDLLSLSHRKLWHEKWVGNIIMCVDLDAFFASCEELRDPSLAGKPHGVIMTDEQKGNITKGAVASCSYEARRVGVRSAMSLKQAKDLCPALILNPVDIPYYRTISEKVMRILREYTDRLEQSSIDEAYLDCTLRINSHASISVEEYALKIKKSIRDNTGLVSSIGVANTKSASKIASNYQKPDGLTIISPDKLTAFFENMVVDAISGIGTKTQQVLKEEFKTKTIGQLAKQDVQKLIDRFGRRHGLWMWQVANGRDMEAVTPRNDNISISTEQTLYPFTKDKEEILKYINELVDEVYNRVNRRGYEFRTVGIKIVRADFSIETREVSYSFFQNKQESIANVIETLLNKFSFWTSDTKNPVRKVGIKLSNLNQKEKKNPIKQRTLQEFI